jgi:hypothetical protein
MITHSRVAIDWRISGTQRLLVRTAKWRTAQSNSQDNTANCSFNSRVHRENCAKSAADRRSWFDKGRRLR